MCMCLRLLTDWQPHCDVVHFAGEICTSAHGESNMNLQGASRLPLTLSPQVVLNAASGSTTFAHLWMISTLVLVCAVTAFCCALTGCMDTGTRAAGIVADIVKGSACGAVPVSSKL